MALKGVNCEGKVVCLNCGKPGHLARDCWSKNRGNRGNGGARQSGNQRTSVITLGSALNIKAVMEPHLLKGKGASARKGGKVFANTAAGEPNTSMPKTKGKVISELLLLLWFWFKNFTWALVKLLSLIVLIKFSFRLINTKS